jgi:hypothetical protein
MVWKLLRTDINPWQIAAYAAANLVGLLIAGLALQFYRDVKPSGSYDEADPLGAARYSVVSRPVTTSLFGDGPEGLTQADLDDIARQPWAEGAAPFIPSGFDVSVGIDFAGRGFSTSLFFEGVSDDYLDIVPDGWGFNPASPEATIILPRDYLALYNFGFAPARGLPTLNEQTVRIAPLKVTISGNGLSCVIPGRIVGFSSRINTIAVPEEFIRWANSTYANNSTVSPNRAIIRLKDPGNPEISRYLAAHNLTESANDEASSRMAYFLQIVAGIIIAVGLLITALAMGLLILSVFLLLQKSRKTLAGLMNLGYSPATLAGYYFRLIAAVNVGVALLTLIGVAVATSVWQTKLVDLGMHTSSVLPTLLTVVVAVVLLTMLSAAIVRNHIRRIPRP